MDLESFVPLVLAVVVVVASLKVARYYVKNPVTRRPFKPHVNDLIPLGVGGVAMIVGGVLQGGGEASVWSWFIDLGAFAIGASLVGTSPVKSWPRWVGLFILGIHFMQVLVTSPGAPLDFVLAELRAFVGNR